MGMKFLQGFFLSSVKSVFIAGIVLTVLLGGLVPSFYVYQVVPSLKVEIFFILLIAIVFVFFLSKTVTDKNYAPILLCLAAITWVFRYLFVFFYDQDFYSDFRNRLIFYYSIKYIFSIIFIRKFWRLI